MKWTREEYIKHMTFEKTEKQMFVEMFGPLIRLDEEWREQGATEDEIGMVGFDWDFVPVVDCGGNTGIMPAFESRVLEDTPEYTLSTDKYGRTVKLSKGYASIPLPLDYPVKTMEDWLKIKPRFEYNENRINWAQVERAKQLQKEGALVVAWMEGGFDLPRELMGEEGACIAYYEDPELMEDILATVAETTYKVLDKISDHLQIDNLCSHEDLAGKSGPLVGPSIVEEFIQPYYRKVWDMLSAKGTKLFSMDSDGNMNPVIDAFLDCGVNIMYPMEPAAGMDIVELRKKYGTRVAFKGGIDKHVLRRSKEEIKKELEYKMQALMQEGGVCFGLDHRIPNGTPLENYKYYIDTARELLGMPPRDKDKRGWARMAF